MSRWQSGHYFLATNSTFRLPPKELREQIQTSIDMSEVTQPAQNINNSSKPSKKDGWDDWLFSGASAASPARDNITRLALSARHNAERLNLTLAAGHKMGVV